MLPSVADTIEVDISRDRQFYDAEPVGTEADHRRFMAEIKAYYDHYATRLGSELDGTRGIVAELGAGSCGLSSLVSKLPSVSRVYACDISAIRMDKMLDLSARIIDAERDKINTRAADFNQRLPFEDGELDAIVFDAALHHTRTMWGLLAECNRVLSPGGLLIAQRESYLSAGRSSRQLAALLRTPEVSAQVSENMYLLTQYSYYLSVSGFAVEFIPVASSLAKRLLKPLNGSLFADGVLFARKQRSI